MSEEERIERAYWRRMSYLLSGLGVCGALLLGLLAWCMDMRAWEIVAFLLLEWLLLGIGAMGVRRLSRQILAAFLARIDFASQSEKAFISNASHELNNPLTAIQGECEITLMRERSVAEYEDSLRRIAMENHRVIQLIKHLLFLARADREHLQSSKERFGLADYLMTFTSAQVSFSPDNFAYQVEANPYLLKIALQNLLRNACKYSGDKPVEMRLRGSVLQIIDQGIGIPPHEVERVAQPFYRASNAQGYAGHGIGLSLSLRILRMYGAQVEISSCLGKGTTITIDFG